MTYSSILNLLTKSLKKKKVFIFLFLIILFGAYLRLNNFHNLVRFNADQIRDAKVVDAMIEDNEFLLLGPKAGGTTFKLGPAFYYLEYLSGMVFGNDPSGIALFVPILGVASIFLFFVFLNFYFSSNVSLVLTFLYATSFYAIRYARFAWNPNAIPFFLFAFLIGLLKITQPKNSKILLWYGFIGITIGIAIQLHTTLLILMPVLFLGAHFFRCFKDKKMHVLRLLITVSIALSLFSPALIYDFQNDGKNIKSFFQGALTKTENNSSFFKNAFLDTEFLLQGNTYTISGIEPQKKWTGIEKLFASKNLQEILLFVVGTGFFIFGLILFILKIKSEGDEQKKRFLWLIFLTTTFSFLLFLPIANELNLRFFIIIIFVPFILIGLVMNFLSQMIRNRKLYTAIIALIVISLAILNIRSFLTTYNLDNYTTRASAYGGISLGETEDISGFISSISKKYPDKKLYLHKFEFNQSISYLNNKKGLSVSAISDDDEKINTDSITFVVVENENLTKKNETISCCYTIISQQTHGRFTILALSLK